MTELLIIPFTLESFFVLFTFVSIFNNYFIIYLKNKTTKHVSKYRPNAIFRNANINANMGK